jgi:hypothetical protein
VVRDHDLLGQQTRMQEPEMGCADNQVVTAAPMDAVRRMTLAMSALAGAGTAMPASTARLADVARNAAALDHGVRRVCFRSAG